MVIFGNRKYACLSCIRGHRSSACEHKDRILLQVRKPGRKSQSEPQKRFALVAKGPTSSSSSSCCKETEYKLVKVPDFNPTSTEKDIKFSESDEADDEDIVLTEKYIFIRVSDNIYRKEVRPTFTSVDVSAAPSRESTQSAQSIEMGEAAAYKQEIKIEADSPFEQTKKVTKRKAVARQAKVASTRRADDIANIQVNGHVIDHADGHVNGHVNENVNSHVTGHVNDHVNGHANNGHTLDHMNGHANIHHPNSHASSAEHLAVQEHPPHPGLSAQAIPGTVAVNALNGTHPFTALSQQQWPLDSNLPVVSKGTPVHQDISDTLRGGDSDLEFAKAMHIPSDTGADSPMSTMSPAPYRPLVSPTMNGDPHQNQPHHNHHAHHSHPQSHQHHHHQQQRHPALSPLYDPPLVIGPMQFQYDGHRQTNILNELGLTLEEASQIWSGDPNNPDFSFAAQCVLPGQCECGDDCECPDCYEHQRGKFYKPPGSEAAR